MAEVTVLGTFSGIARSISGRESNVPGAELQNLSDMICLSYFKLDDEKIAAPFA